MRVLGLAIALTLVATSVFAQEYPQRMADLLEVGDTISFAAQSGQLSVQVISPEQYQIAQDAELNVDELQEKYPEFKKQVEEYLEGILVSRPGARVRDQSLKSRLTVKSFARIIHIGDDFLLAKQIASGRVDALRLDKIFLVSLNTRVMGLSSQIEGITNPRPRRGIEPFQRIPTNDFNVYDLNADQVLSGQELDRLPRELVLDTNEDGEISRTEFLTGFREYFRRRSGNTNP